MSTTAPHAQVLKEQRSLCGHRTYFKEEGIDWEDFQKEPAWAQMKNKPYFYVLSVGPPGDPHETIKFGISANGSPHGRLFEYYRFYSGKFKVHLILTFMQWKELIPSGWQAGPKPLQERFEDKIKAVTAHENLIARPNEWVKKDKMAELLFQIQEVREDCRSSQTVSLTKIKLHHPPHGATYKGTTDASLLKAGTKTPKSPDIKARIKKLVGKTVAQAFKTKVKYGGGFKLYEAKDLMYDIKMKYMTT